MTVMLSIEQAAYRLAFLIADALIRGGASSASTTKSLLSIFRKTGMPDVTVSVSLGQVTVSHQDRPDEPPRTRILESEPGTLDIGLRTQASDVLEAFLLDRISAEEGIHRMEQIMARAGVVGHRRVMTGFALFGTGFSLLLGGGLVTTVSATVIAAAVYGAYAAVEHFRAPGIFSLAAGGLAAVLGASASGMFFSTSQTAVCIVAALASWLAGIAAYGAVHDVITGWYLSASGRILEVVTSTAGLVAGVTLGIYLMQPLFGESMNYIEVLETDSTRWGLSVLGAAVVSAGFALASGGHGWTLPALGLFGGLVELAVLGLDAAGVSSYGAILIAAIAAGAMGVVLTRALNIASNATLMVVLLPLFPGMLVYQGVLGTIFREEGAGDSVLEAAITAFCLSMGGILGQYLASEVLWAVRRRQFARARPGQVFRKEMLDDRNLHDIMVPIFSKPFTR